MKKKPPLEPADFIEENGLKIYRNFSLKPYNTMGLDASAAWFVSVSDADELKSAVTFARRQNLPLLFLGGGSNILFVHNFSGLVIKLALKGEHVLSEDEAEVLVKVAAGENWHEFVLRCVERGWGGIENLSLIPGSAGAAPIQNIGAYGVEFEDVVQSVQYFDLETEEIREISAPECRFGYRDSIFKNELKGKAAVLSFVIRLKKNAKVNTSYRALAEYLAEKGIGSPTIKQVSEAVIEIRRSKLPDPAEIGNSGSFFKNPVLPAEKYQQLKEKHPEIPAYPLSETAVKVPAAWLIDHAGWKGKRAGDAGMHKKQALVLVNYGQATGRELWNFAQRVQQDVAEKFGIKLEPEVNVLS